MTTPEPSPWTLPHRSSDALEVYLLGRVDFEAAQLIQERIVDETARRTDRHGTLLICEHPPVVTIGRDGSWNDLLVEAEDFTARTMDVRRVPRGGQTIVHVPGQLAVYPLLPLDRHQLGVSDYVTRLQRVILQVAAERKVTAEPVSDVPGAACRCGQFGWIAGSIRSGVSLNGFFLNVTPRLDLMRLVRSTPRGRSIASLSMQLMQPVPMSKVRESIVRHVAEQFGYEDLHLYSRHPLLERTTKKVVQYV